MTKEVPQDMQDVINEVSSTTSGRGDLTNQYKVLDTIIEDSLKGVAYNEKYKGYDVQVQDQYSDIVDYFLCRQILNLTLAQNATIDTRTLTVTNATGVVVGTYVCIQENSRAFQAQVLSINGNILTIDTPLDYSFTTDCLIANRNPNLNVNGSVTPQIAFLAPKAGVKWDVTRLIFQMTHSSAGADNLFGNLSALTKGIVIRKSDGIHHTVFNAKTNGDLAVRMYDIMYTDRSTPSQSYGTRGRRSFNGQDKNGVAIRLDGDLNEQLQIIIQDDLSTLTSFRLVAQGHVVEG